MRKILGINTCTHDSHSVRPAFTSGIQQQRKGKGDKRKKERKEETSPSPQQP